MRWKKDFSAVNYRLIGLLALIVLGIYGCAGHPVKIMPEGYVRPDVLAAAWDKLVDVETLVSRGVIKLEARDGQKNSQRIRFTAKTPGLLKVQWLTPWYTVAWQLLIVDREFWLSDSKGQITYHGDLGMGIPTGSCDQHNKWWTYIELMASWLQLLSKPPPMLMKTENVTDPGLADLPVTHTQYLVAEDGTMPPDKVFPQRLEILCPAAKLDLRFESPRLNNKLKERIFTYQQKNFRLKEVDCHNFLIP